jgi:hypothetical protein
MPPNNAYVYGWDAEPTDERPSEFASTTGYSALSGYHQPVDLSRRVARRQGSSSGAFLRIVLAFSAILGACASVLYVIARLTH